LFLLNILPVSHNSMIWHRVLEHSIILNLLVLVTRVNQ